MPVAFAQFRKLLAERKGSVAVIFGLAVLPLMGFTGAAIDYSRAASARTLLQTALDVAVLAGAKDGSANWTTVARSALASTVPPFLAGLNPSFSFDAQSETYSGSASSSIPAMVLQLVGIRSMPVGANASAKFINKTVDNSCILALGVNPSGNDDLITFNGAPNVNLTGCTQRSNGSIRCNGHSSGASASIAVGTASCSNPQSGAEAVKDIYAPLAVGIEQRCSGTVGAVWSDTTSPTTKITVPRGGYNEYHICGTLTLSGAGTLAGTSSSTDTVIVIENGGLDMAPSASIQLARTTFVLTGNNTRTTTIDPSNLSLSPSTGSGNPWRGLSIYLDPVLTSRVEQSWGPHAVLNLNGIVYMPRADLTLKGSSTTVLPTCSKLVVQSLRINGSVDLNLSQSTSACSALGVSQWTSGGTLVLSQ